MRDPFEEVPISQRIGVLVAFVLVASGVILGLVRPTALGTVAVIGAFFLMIMLHELGHFVMAKRAGMKVTEFFVGFGPRIWSVRRGETEYGVKALPLGGYCKIVGMTNLDEVDPADEARTYRSKRYLPKLGVAVAGSAMHFVIAVVLMFVVLVGSGDWARADSTTTIGFVRDDSPAARAGLRAGDRVLTVDGHEIEGWQDVVDRIVPSADEPLAFVVERDGDIRTVTVTPEEVEVPGTDETRGFAGVGTQVHVPQPGIVESAWRAPAEIVDLGGESVKALGRIFSFSGIRNYFENLAEPDEDADERFVSPVGFGRLANQAVAAGWVETLTLLITINVFVGIFNLAPLLPFDGGHVAIATYEKVASSIRHRRVQVDVAKLLPVTAAVVAILGFIFLSSLFLDLSNPIENPF